MMDMLHRLFRPHRDIPPPPNVDLSTEAYRRRIEERQIEVLARLELLRIETENIAARQAGSYGVNNVERRNRHRS